MRKIWVLVRKEWSEVFKNRFVLFTTAFLPLLFTALPLATLYFGGTSSDVMSIAAEDMPAQFSAMCRDLSGEACGQYFILMQFMMLFMLVPMMVPITFASYSIVGEKSTRTLEPLLATPIKTSELLAGKAAAAVIPGVGATWLSFIIFVVGVRLILQSPEVVGALLSSLWLTAVFVVGPLLAIAGVSIAVMISSRVSDPRVAEQISIVFILPIIGVFIAQSSGLFSLNQQIIYWMALGLVLLDVGLLAFATQLFQRETILTRWK